MAMTIYAILSFRRIISVKPSGMKLKIFMRKKSICIYVIIAWMWISILQQIRMIQLIVNVKTLKSDYLSYFVIRNDCFGEVDSNFAWN